MCDGVRRQPARAPRGVPECGLRRLHPPTFPPSLDHRGLSPPPYNGAADLESGGMLNDMNHINMLQGVVAD